MRTFVFFLVMAFSLIPHAQTSPFLHECDTINMDELYIIENGRKHVIDTNVTEVVEGNFSIVNARFLDTNYCMIHATLTDTDYTVYDSVMIDESWVYKVDTSYTEKSYHIMVEDEPEVSESLVWLYFFLAGHKLDEDTEIIIPLRLQRYYNIVKTTNLYEDRNVDSAIINSCDQCHVIILHGKKELIRDCPLYDNLYRMK